MDYLPVAINKDFTDMNYRYSHFKQDSIIPPKYKIVNDKNGYYYIQCCLFRTVFKVHLAELIRNIDIISGLNPIEASYIGILALSVNDNIAQCIEINKKNYQYVICGEGRGGNTLIILNKKYNIRNYYTPAELINNNELLSLFHPYDAYFIGLRFAEKEYKNKAQRKRSPSYLKVVK